MKNYSEPLIRKLINQTDMIKSGYSAVFFVTMVCLITFRCIEQPAENSYVTCENMISISSKGTEVQLGSYDTWAANDEKPPMLVKFSYDFMIDSTEVTVKQFWQVTRYLPKEYRLSDTSRLIPICHVTWFDAILYCNKRSLQEGLDTVYSYLAADKTPDNRTYRITGLGIDFSRQGYRLPTEAEWEYCARAGTKTVFYWGNDAELSTAGDYAWSAHNSGDTVHEAATRLSNGFHLYDMAGNAMEWVNDWASVYRTDTIEDFAGYAVTGDDTHPVRGGSFAHTIEKLRSSSRSDDYAAVSSTARRYIGFRCCRGTISNPQYMPASGVKGSFNPVTVSGGALRSTIGDRRVKVVFVNNSGGSRNLCFVDFSEPDFRVRYFADKADVFMPTISPDGEWVAYCTRAEGWNGGSEIFIRKLDTAGASPLKLDDTPAFVPRWRVDPVTADTFIVYTSSTVLNTELLWLQTQTKMQKMVGGKPVGNPVVMEGNGSFHGGVSYDEKYLATGHPLLRMKNRSSGELKTLFTAPFNGKAAADTSQVCNVSITPDPYITDRVLFLDFGSGFTTSTLTGFRYSSHEVIFMCDYSGQVIKWFKRPDGTLEWEDPEWSNSSRYVVAGVKSATHPDNRSDVYVVDLEESRYIPVVRGTDLWHPNMWISEAGSRLPADIALDSIGQYNEPPAHVYQAQFAMKMPGFWQFRDSVEVLFLGSSHMLFGAAPSKFEPLFGMNMGYSGGGLAGIKNIVNNYAINHCSRLKVVVICLDICWYNLPGGDDTWMNGSENTKGYLYDRNHGFWKSGLPDGFIDAVVKAPNPVNPLMDERGWEQGISSGWGKDTIAVPPAWIWEMDSNVLANLATLDTIIKNLQAHNLHVVGAIMPMSPNFKKTPVFGTYGPSWNTAMEIESHIKAIDSKYDNFILHDAYNSGINDYVYEDFYDESHLSRSGGLKFSAGLDSLIDSVLAR